MLCAGMSRAIKTEGVPGAVCASFSASLCSWWQGWWCRCYRTTQAVPASLSSLVPRTLEIPSVPEMDQAPSSADHSRATAGRASPMAWRGSWEKSCRGPGGQTSAAHVRKKRASKVGCSSKMGVLEPACADVHSSKPIAEDFSEVESVGWLHVLWITARSAPSNRAASCFPKSAAEGLGLPCCKIQKESTGRWGWQNS